VAHLHVWRQLLSKKREGGICHPDVSNQKHVGACTSLFCLGRALLRATVPPPSLRQRVDVLIWGVLIIYPSVATWHGARPHASPARGLGGGYDSLHPAPLPSGGRTKHSLKSTIIIATRSLSTLSRRSIHPLSLQPERGSQGFGYPATNAIQIQPRNADPLGPSHSPCGP
jgi:hypothetical protein